MARSPRPVRRRSRSTADLELFAPTSSGLEPALARELRGLGARDVRPAERGVAFRGDARLVYRANLWLRTAHRVLWRIAEFPATNRRELYEGARAVGWDEHLTLERTLAVDAVGQAPGLDHTQFVARVVKDAVVDWFRDRTGRRPSVDPAQPDLALNARLAGGRCALSIDTSGERMHRRGYRPAFGAAAPLKETIAAGILLLSGYAGERPLVDPFCGSGTILVEAALIATRTAPGLLGRRFGLSRHPAFDRRLFREVQEEARAEIRELDGCPIAGADLDEDALRAAAAAARGAGVDDLIRLKRADARELTVDAGSAVVTNPPYGERLGEVAALAELYERFGVALKRGCRGASAHVLTGSKYLAGRLGLRAERRDPLRNGRIDCRLMHYELY